MTCDEFRRTMNRSLDLASVLPEEARGHATECAACRSYDAELSSLHELLMGLPPEPARAELVDELVAVPERPLSRFRVRLRSIHRGEIFHASFVLLALLSALLLPAWRAIIQTTALSYALGVLAFAILKPRFY